MYAVRAAVWDTPVQHTVRSTHNNNINVTSSDAYLHMLRIDCLFEPSAPIPVNYSRGSRSNDNT